MEITKAELKKKTRVRLKRKGLSYSKFLDIVGERYFDFTLHFLRTMEEARGDSIKRYFKLLGGKE
mgnify:CR=1 FL=1